LCAAFAAVPALAPLAPTACLSPSSAGIPLAGDAVNAELQGLTRRAKAGDKQAQLDLGIACEDGRCVPRDLRKAERLYRLAATDSGGRTRVYPPPESGGP